MQPLQPGMGHMVPPPPPPLSEELPCWWDEVWASPVDVRRRIFCNRSLNMQHIKVPRLLSPCSPPREILSGRGPIMA